MALHQISGKYSAVIVRKKQKNLGTQILFQWHLNTLNMHNYIKIKEFNHSQVKKYLSSEHFIYKVLGLK